MLATVSDLKGRRMELQIGSALVMMTDITNTIA
jgi:hypothetical protein